ncbi:hypothetical protein IP70_13180 [alpha proteobacterium AAP38]|nr:hypothetical protein IP70_13180 [alpha proteobacterium AAP38]
MPSPILIYSINDARCFVRAERRRRKLSQSFAAGMAGYTQKWLSDFESGRTDPPFSMVLRMMRTFGGNISVQLANIEMEPESELDLELETGLS